MKDRIYLSPPEVGSSERELLLDAFDSNWIAPLGPHVDAFETEFAEKVGTGCAVALSSGTAALHLALILSGVKAGDTVLTSSLTFVATANAIRYVGAEPVFIDCDSSSWNLDPSLLERELHESAKRGQLPAAVLAVDICGQAADWDAINEICRQYDIPTIEDAAESLGATYRGRPAGSLADIGCFSFNGNKIITTSGGGMLVTNNPELAERAKYLSTQARELALHYEHSEVGYNYRLSNLLAALGRGQLAHLDSRVESRRSNFKHYNQELGNITGISFMPEAPYGKSTRWLTCMLLDPASIAPSPAEICEGLGDSNIEARPMWKPMHLQPLYSRNRVVGGAVSEQIYRKGLCLPSGSSLSPANLKRVCDIFRQLATASTFRDVA